MDNHQPPIDHHLAKVLITELLWGKGVLKPDNARPIKLVLNSSSVLKHYLQEKDASSDNKLTAVKGRLCNLLFFFICSSLIMDSGENQNKGFYQTEYHNPNSALCKLFIYSLFMFTLPIAAYFATIYVFAEYFHIPKSDSYIYAVVLSVIVVNLVIFAYVFEAFREGKEEKKKE